MSANNIEKTITALNEMRDMFNAEIRPERGSVEIFTENGVRYTLYGELYLFENKGLEDE